MQEKGSVPTVRKSVFKSGENTVSSALLTQKWLELINRIERNRRTRDSK